MKKRHMNPSLCRLSGRVLSRNMTTLLCAGALGAVGHSALAANDVWIGNTDANFATLSNWTGSVTPNGNTPVFGVAGTAGATLTTTLLGPPTPASLSIVVPAPTPSEATASRSVLALRTAAPAFRRSIMHHLEQCDAHVQCRERKYRSGWGVQRNDSGCYF